MIKIMAINCPGYLSVKKMAGGKVEVQAVFRRSGGCSPVAIVDWEQLHRILRSKADLHYFEDCNLRRTIRDTLEKGDFGITKRITRFRMFFTPSPQGNSLIIVSRANLKKALALTFRW